MNIRNSLFTALIFSSGVASAQLNNLPQTFKPLDVGHLNAYYPNPHGSWFPTGSDQQDSARQRYLYLAPIGLRGVAHVPESMNWASCREITHPALRVSNGEIEIAYYEVLGVDPRGPAASYIEEGDLIVGVDGVDLKSGDEYNPDNTYSTKGSRTLFECLGEAIDRAEGVGSITFKVMRLPENLSVTTPFPEKYVEAHRTDMINGYQDRVIEIDTSAAEVMELIAETGGNGNASDHAYWLDGRWVMEDDSEVPIVDQEWQRISVGWGSPVWGNEITYSAGTTTNSLFAHAHSEVQFAVPTGAKKFRVTLRNNSRGSIVGAIRTAAAAVDYGELTQYITEVTMPVEKIGSYFAGGAEREHKLEQMITSQAAWLLGEQRSDGGWSGLGSYTSDVWDTSYIGLAMLAADEPRFDEAAKRAAYYIVNKGSVTDWTSPRGIALTFLAEYYLRTGDAGILPGLQVAVKLVEQNTLAQGYSGHKVGYGYGTGGQNSGFSYVAMGLAVASRTPVEVDENLLGVILERMDAMAVNGVIGYGRTTTEGYNSTPSAVDAVAMTGPCVAANSITGHSQRFFDRSKDAMERSVGGLDFGHSTQTYGLFGGTIATINLGDALYQRHQELTMPKMILQRYYAGGVVVSENRNEYMGAEGFFRPRMATAVKVLTLAAGRRNLAITGDTSLQEATMKPGRNTHVWDMETHRFYLRAWAVAIELLGADAPASLHTGYEALKEIDYNGALHSLHNDIYAVLEANALTAVGDINAMTGVSDKAKAEAIETLLGVDLEINIVEKDLDLVDVKLAAYWPLRERNRWADNATRNAWKANTSFKMAGSISIANAGALSADVTIPFDSSSAGTDWSSSYSSSLGTVEVTRVDGSTEFTLPVQITYTVGSHTISYVRDATFEAALGANREDTRYVTIPSARVARKTKGDELVVELGQTGEYLQMHGPLAATFHQGEKVQVEFKQLNLALGGHRNATSFGSPLSFYRGVTFTAAPGSTVTQASIDNLQDASGSTSSNSRSIAGETWTGFEMDLGEVRHINGILVDAQGNNPYKVEAEIDGIWTQIYSGGFIRGIDYFGDHSTQRLRIYWKSNGSGYSPNINDIQVFHNSYGDKETEVAQLQKNGVEGHWRLWQERYDGLSGGTIAALKASPNYPASPSSSGALFTTDSGDNIGEYYGQRWSGWITPNETGDYTFYAAADDQVELYLSTDEHPANKALIASKYSWTAPRSWSNGAISSTVTLVAGKKYYIELLHAEAGGGDNCAIAWRKPSDTAAPANGSAGITDSYLSSVVGGISTTQDYVFPTITTQPAAVLATEGQATTFSVVAGGAGSLTYTWMKNGIVQRGATSAIYTISAVTGADAGHYTCLVRNEYGQVLSQSAELSFVNQRPQAPDRSFSVAENTPLGTSVGFVNANDLDAGTSLNYAITAGNIENAFSINAATGEISVAAEIDYELLSGYLLEVTVSDDGAPSLSDSALISINIDNLYDVAPVMTDETARVADDVIAGTFVAQMNAYDQEVGDSVAYSITGGNVGGAFAIDSVTGKVTTAAALDSSVTSSYLLEISATDQGGQTDVRSLDIVVYEVLDAIGWNFSQRSDAYMVQGEGSIYGSTQWTDSVDHAAPAGSSTANSSDAWAVTTPVNASMVSVTWSSQNMHQSGSTTTLEDQMFAKYLDDGGAGPQITLTGLSQWLTSVNATSYSVTFYQSSDTGNNRFASMNVYSGAGTGGTLLESLPVALTDGSGAGSGSRLVRIANELLTEDTITFHTDRGLGGGGRASIAGFKITAVKGPNTAPIFVDSSQTIGEDAAINSVVAVVSANDSNPGDVLSYSITSGNAAGAFAINAATGEITTATALDYETTPSYSLTVTATDSGGLSNTAIVSVAVTNVTVGDDSDSDGLDDDWEVTHFGNTSHSDGTGDSDGDGQNDLSEFQASSDPTLASDVFKITELTQNGNAVTLQWASKNGKTYRVEYSYDMTTWTPAETGIEGTGGEVTRVHAAAQETIFYRVAVE